MQRQVLDNAHIHPVAQSKQGSFHRETIERVQAAIRQHDVVVLGMNINPFPRRARQLLDSKNIPYHYLGWGSYLSEWKPRLAIKLWTGWPTFPQIFVKGVLIGGFTDLKQLVESGELERLLMAPRVAT